MSYADRIDVTLRADGGVTVDDNGRGIPVDEHPVEHRPAVEIVLTTLHAGGKFGGNGYAVSGGLHGVGVSVVNALSSRLTIEIHAREGSTWTQDYVASRPATESFPDRRAPSRGPRSRSGPIRTSSRRRSTTSRPCRAAFRRWRSSIRASPSGCATSGSSSARTARRAR